MGSLYTRLPPTLQCPDDQIPDDQTRGYGWRTIDSVFVRAKCLTEERKPSGVMEILARQITSSPEDSFSTSNPSLPFTACSGSDPKCGTFLTGNIQHTLFTSLVCSPELSLSELGIPPALREMEGERVEEQGTAAALERQ
ncbi:unnamed protein product [Leuciscus chuanchicus]